jgi:hypothetical protein
MRATWPVRHPSRFRLLGVAATLLVAIPASIGVVSAAPDKTYALSINQVTLVAGETYGGVGNPRLTLTVSNTSPQPQELGSMNLTVPTGVTITSAVASQGTAAVAGSSPQVVQLRNLALMQGGDMTVELSADVECSSAHDPYIWSSHGKQSNDFNGTGNDLTPSSNPLTNFVAGGCRLLFTGQPNDARTGETVTTALFDPDASRVEVTVATGDTSTVDAVTWGSWTITLSETGPGTFAAGSDVVEATASGAGAARSATFTPALTAAGPYTLVATTGTTDVTDGTSDGFVVVDFAVQCPATGPCTSGSRPASTSSVEVSTTSSNAGFATVSFNPSGTENLCGRTDGSDVFDVDITESVENKTVKITIQKAFVTKAANKYNVCVRLAEPFTTAEGVLTTEGNLPNCVDPAEDAPCVVSRSTVKGSVEIVFVLEPGDPPAKAW